MHRVSPGMDALGAFADWADRRATQVSRRQAWLADPDLWCADRTPHSHYWSAQREVFASVRDHTRTAVKACHGVGKSWIAARIAAWWIDSHPPNTAIVLTTAPTWPQVEKILWKEIRRVHREAKLGGYITQDAQWKTRAGDILGFGRKPADHDEHGFQGIHAPHVLVILDEGCGIPRQLFTAAESVITNDSSRILVIGNPDDPAAEFAAACKPGSGYNVLTISAFDSPNLTGEPVPDSLASQLVSRSWVEDKRRRWGEGSPLWQSKVAGEFPATSDHALIEPAWVQAAQSRELAAGFPYTLGVDVARFGTDRTIIGHRQGGRFRVIRDLASSSTTETTGLVLQLQAELTFPEARVDGVGVGGGVVDMLVEAGAPVIDMQAGASPSEQSMTLLPDGRRVHRFTNARAEWYWGLRELFRAGLVDIDPSDLDLAAQLLAIQWEVDSKGRVKIESKDAMAARGMPSPDRADAMMLAFADVTTSIVEVVDADEWADLDAGMSPTGPY